MNDIKSLQEGKYILWGAENSAYSAKLRAYLIKKDIDYIELNPSHPHFKTNVLPRIGHFTVPVLETPDGHIVADSTEAIEYLEPLYPELPALPEDKTMAALAQIIHSYGADGLNKTFMYYRWATTHANRCFTLDEFTRAMFQKEQRDPKEVEQLASKFRGFLHPLGVNGSHSVDKAIESSSHQLYDILNQHFIDYPYLLGGLPSLADYGLFMGIFPHQGRDPSTSGELKLRAPALNRWMETMQRKAIIDAEVYHVPKTFFKPDEIPQTLKNLLSLIFADFGPEVIATAHVYHQWLKVSERPSGTIISHDCQKENHQALGEITHLQQGTEIKRIAFLDCLIQHQRIVNVINGMDTSETNSFQALMGETGGKEVTDLRLKRDMVRNNFAYVVD